jgi:hypothetical protein
MAGHHTRRGAIPHTLHTPHHPRRASPPLNQAAARVQPCSDEEPPAAAIDSVCTNLPPLSLDIHPSPSPHCSNTGDVSATQAVRAERPWFLRAVLQCVHRRVAVTCGRGRRRRARRPTPARVRPAHAPHPPFSGAPASVRQSTMLPAPWVWEPVSLNQCAWREIRRRRAQACPRDVTSNPPSIVSEGWVGSGAQPHSPFSPPNPELWQPSPLRWAYSAVLAVCVAPSHVSGLWLTPVLC